MIGILVEKPSAKRNFSKALGGDTGTFNGESYGIVNARGHMDEFVAPAQQVPTALSKKYSDWNIGNLPWDETHFSWKREEKKDAGQQLRQIKSALSTCDEVVIATDVDPTGEGELLAWEIIDELGIHPKKFSRMYFMDESEKEVQKAFINRKPLTSMESDMDYVKALHRSQWDLLSMQFTRIATHCVGGGAVIRQGRLKSVMVKIVGDGLKAYNDYVKVVKYTNKFRDENGIVYSNPEEPIYDKKEDVPTGVYHTSDVVCDKKEVKYTAPPKLIDLAALSSTLVSRGYDSKTVLDVYQKMYEAKVVSYPRTEDKVITPEQFNDLLPLVDDIAKVVGVDTSLLTHRSPRKTHVKTGGAHGANRPGPNVPKSLSGLVQYGACAPDIYEILAKNYLAMLAEDYQYESQKGHVKDFPKFTGVAAVPMFAGWKAVYQDINADDEDDDSAKGLGTSADPYIADVVNPRPPRPTMKWLMKQLEKHDVGTGATRTSTYAEVTNQKSKYPLMKDSSGKITMSDYGDMSYILIQGTKIADVAVTEALMAEMRDIAAGKLDPAACLANMQDMVRFDMKVMLDNQKNLSQLGDKVMGKAQRPQGAPKEKYSGEWKGKQVSFTRTWSTHRFTDDECERLLKDEEIVIDDLISQSGKPYAIHGKLANQTYNGHKYVGFKNLGFVDKGDARIPGFPMKFCDHEFTQDELDRIADGEEILVEGLVSKKQSVFSGLISYGRKDDGNMGLVMKFPKR